MRVIRLLSPAEGDGGEAAQTDLTAEALAHAVGRYRERVASAPGIVPELVRGETIEEIDASVEIARQAYEAVGMRIAREHEERVPTGNPSRSSTDLGAAGLKPEAKIALGLRRR